MSGPGHRASLPAGGHARPEYLAAGEQGTWSCGTTTAKAVSGSTTSRSCRSAGPMQASLAALFAARCTPGRWAVHATSMAAWHFVRQFTEFLARQQRPPRDLDELTPALVRQWRESLPAAPTGYRTWRIVSGLLRDDARLQAGPVADELARRRKIPRGQAPVLHRGGVRPVHRGRAPPVPCRAAAHQRQRAAPAAVAGRGVRRGQRGLGPRRGTGRPGPHRRPAQVPWHGARQAEVRQRVRRPVRRRDLAAAVPDPGGGRRAGRPAAGGVRLEPVGDRHPGGPRAAPDQGDDGRPTYRVPLVKPRRGPGRHHETRNVTDDGAGSPGRLITQALQATRFARAVVGELAPGTDRLIVWRTARPGQMRTDLDSRPPVGLFCLGVRSNNAADWARAEGLSGSPFQRGRRTVVALDRREPAQHSRDTHDRRYVLPDDRVRAAAVEVIAAGAEDAAGRARKAVLAAGLRDRPAPGTPRRRPRTAPIRRQPLAVAGRRLRRLVPGLPGLPERAGPSWPPSPPRASARGAGQPALRPAARRLGSGLARRPRAAGRPQGTGLGGGPWAQGLARVTGADREIVAHLLTGDLDT